MPFHPDEDIEYIREQRTRAANRIVSGAPFASGDGVRITGPLAPGINLVEPAGIVTGYMQAGGGQVSVLCSWADGMERELTLPASSIVKIDG